MRLTPYQTALLLALLFRRAASSRARLSESTIRKLSGRLKLRIAFMTSLRDALEDVGFAFFEIERGYAMVPLLALNGAPAITAKKFMPDLALKIKKREVIDFPAIEQELDLDEGDGTDVEEM